MVDEKLIDLDSGLARVGGNMTLFKRLLGKYADGGYIEKLLAHIADGDIGGASADAHTIKGVAANLSLMAVNAAAVELEHALKNGGDYSAFVEKLSELHNATLSEIAKIE